MKAHFTNIFLFSFILLFCINLNAQIVKVIDNKGTINSIDTSSGVAIGHFIIDSGDNTSDKVVTGLPFSPSKITFVAYTNIGQELVGGDNGFIATPPGDNINAHSVHNSFGSMNGYAIKGTPIKQQVIYIGGSGHSINNISRFATNLKCIGLRFSNQNGKSLGKITGKLKSFNNDGFTLFVNYYAGVLDNSSTYPDGGTSAEDLKKIIRPGHIMSRKVLVMYTAYR